MGILKVLFLETFPFSLMWDVEIFIRDRKTSKLEEHLNPYLTKFPFKINEVLYSRYYNIDEMSGCVCNRYVLCGSNTDYNWFTMS